jgi:rubrerythrin
MEEVTLFLVHAIQLERDAARRFEDLMHSMQTAGNREVEALFRRLAELSRKHLRSAMERSGFQSLPELAPEDFVWPDEMTPEAAGWHGVDDGLDVLGALQLALAGERSGQAYYAAVAKTTTDPEVLSMAREFAAEEAQHVSELEHWLARYAA